MKKYHFSHLEEYSTFDSVEELNHHVNRFRNKTTATEFKVLWFISRYAVKFIGTAHLKLSTIADGINMSTKTVQRAIKSLVSLNAIEKISTLVRLSLKKAVKGLILIKSCFHMTLMSRRKCPSVKNLKSSITKGLTGIIQKINQLFL